MRATTRWVTAIGFILALMAIGCAGGIDLSKLPPIVISAPPPAVPSSPPVVEQPAPRATVAFVVVDDATGAPIPTAIATFEDDTIVQANDDGYIAIEKPLDTYQVKVSANDYLTHIVDVVLTENRQFSIRLASTKPKPAPEPASPPAPKPEPPVVTPPVVANPLDEAAGWSDEQWRVYVKALLARSGGALVNDASMKVARPELNARGADFQNGWRGDLRPRIFLPVAGCPPATRADVPPCSYNRTVDLGQYGEPWDWIKR